MTGAREDLDLARARALRYLEGRERSRREVELRLKRYGHEEELVAAVIGWLEELAYVDDRRFALSYAREKSRAGWGARRIRAGLAGAGVSPTVIAESLEEMAADMSAEGTASSDEPLAAMISRRFGREYERDPEGATRRAAAYLQRRGHDWDTIKRVLRTAFEDREEQGFC